MEQWRMVLHGLMVATLPIKLMVGERGVLISMPLVSLLLLEKYARQIGV